MNPHFFAVTPNQLVNLNRVDEIDFVPAEGGTVSTLRFTFLHGGPAKTVEGAKAEDAWGRLQPLLSAAAVSA